MLRHEHHGLYTSVSQNKNDFSICLKVPNLTAGSRSTAGRAFQEASPEVLKAHSPRVTVRVRVESAVDGHPMIAAEDDHGPLQRVHIDGSGSQVPNHEDIYTSTGTTCR